MTRCVVTPSALAYGGGINSTAMAIDLVKRGMAPNLILMADTGGELPLTYKYVEIFSEWLVSNGAPPIEMVKKGGRDETLEEYCHRSGFLPSIAYGHKSCSHKFKIEPQDRECNRFPLFKEHWKAGGKVIKYIGYSSEEKARVTRAKTEDKKYIYRFPLYEQGIDREGCLDIIREEGLPLPGKSACFFCPASKKHEIIGLRNNHPDLFARAIALEDMANERGRHDQTRVKGLGRNFSWRNVQEQMVLPFPQISGCIHCVDDADDRDDCAA